MGRFGLKPELEFELFKKMQQLGISESDIQESYFKPKHKGKELAIASGVILRHLPTDIEIRLNETAEQAKNRYHARIELCARIEKKFIKPEFPHKGRKGKGFKNKKRGADNRRA